MNKPGIDPLTHAVLCCEEFRHKHGPVLPHEIMASAWDTSPVAMRKFCERAQAKFKRKWLELGLSETEALMCLEAMRNQREHGAQREPLDSPVYNG